jgi:serine protease Do
MRRSNPARVSLFDSSQRQHGYDCRTTCKSYQHGRNENTAKTVCQYYGDVRLFLRGQELNLPVTKFFFTAMLCLGEVSLSAQTTALVTGTSSRTRNALDDFSQTVQHLIMDVSPAVVAVVVESFGRPEGESGGKTNVVGHQTREGTGVLVSADGYLITNAHVVQSAQRAQIRPGETGTGVKGGPRRSPLTADVVGVDQETDLAVLKISGTDWKYLTFVDSSKVRKGEVVFAVGSPRGLENSVSMGIVSAAERELNVDSSFAFIQTDAPINPGNSGGPLVNTHGEIAGINTFIFSSSGGSEGLGFAIPASLVKDVYAQIRRYGKVRRGELGVVARSVTPTIARALSLPRESGVLIQDVLPGKAAADAGLQMDDIVVSVEGRSVANLRQFSSNLLGSEIGQRLKLGVLRKGEVLELQVALQEPDNKEESLMEKAKQRAVAIPRIGVLAVALDSDTVPLIAEPKHDFGSIVAAKLQTTRVFQEELEPGDVIFGINGQTAIGIEALTRLLNDIPDGRPIVAQVQREGILRYLVLVGE